MDFLWSDQEWSKSIHHHHYAIPHDYFSADLLIHLLPRHFFALNPVGHKPSLLLLKTEGLARDPEESGRFDEQYEEHYYKRG